MTTKLIFIFAMVFTAFQLSAQEVRSDTVHISKEGTMGIGKSQDSTKVFEWEPSTSLYLELFGKGFYSINVDFRKTKFKAWSIGLWAGEGGIFPGLMYYHFGGKRFRFETGGGFTIGFTGDEGLAGMFLHGVVGYRYQVKKGLIFRGGFTPLIGIPFTDEGSFAFLPWGGVSLGYSF